MKIKLLAIVFMFGISLNGYGLASEYDFGKSILVSSGGVGPVVSRGKNVYLFTSSGFNL